MSFWIRFGSGQVAVVSKMKERHYIGFEIVPAYYEFALDRLESGKYLIQKTEEEPVWDLFSIEHDSNQDVV